MYTDRDRSTGVGWGRGNKGETGWTGSRAKLRPGSERWSGGYRQFVRRV